MAFGEKAESIEKKGHPLAQNCSVTGVTGVKPHKTDLMSNLKKIKIPRNFMGNG